MDFIPLLLFRYSIIPCHSAIETSACHLSLRLDHLRSSENQKPPPPWTRPAAAAESRPKGGCCNQRLSGLMGDVAKISFQTQSHSKHEYLHSKQQPTIDKSAEAQHAERVPLSAQKKRLPNAVARASPCQTIELL